LPWEKVLDEQFLARLETNGLERDKLEARLVYLSAAARNVDYSIHAGGANRDAMASFQSFDPVGG